MCFFHYICSQASLQWLLHRNWRSINAVNLKTQLLALLSRQGRAAVPRAADPKHNANTVFCQAILRQARNRTPALLIRSVHHSLFFNFLLIKKKSSYLKNTGYLSSMLREMRIKNKRKKKKEEERKTNVLSGPLESQEPLRTFCCEECVDLDFFVSDEGMGVRF